MQFYEPLTNYHRKIIESNLIKILRSATQMLQDEEEENMRKIFDAKHVNKLPKGNPCEKKF